MPTSEIDDDKLRDAAHALLCLSKKYPRAWRLVFNSVLTKEDMATLLELAAIEEGADAVQ